MYKHSNLSSSFTVPLAQVKTLYTALDNNKENRKPLGKEISVKENGLKKTQKKQPEKRKEVKEKPPTPKSLEMAVRLVSYLYRWQMSTSPRSCHAQLLNFSHFN
jgi:hypothetical protein